MLKNAFFWEKNKNRGAPPPDPRVVTHTYYYNFVEFVFGNKCVLFRSKKKPVTTANVLPLLSQFCTYFFIQLCKFC